MDPQGAILGLFNNLINIGTAVGVTVAAFFIMWGAYLYMSASGNPLQMRAGKSAMVNALIGLALVLLARAVAALIQTALGGQASTRALSQSNQGGQHERRWYTTTAGDSHPSGS